MYKVGLCKGRHEIPEVDNYIFPETVNPLDVEGLEKQAGEYFNRLAKGSGGVSVDLYVTGLTVALVAAINAAWGNIDLRLFHYDRDSGTYYPQRVCTCAWLFKG